MNKIGYTASWVMAVVGTIAMTAVIAHGFIDGNFRQEGRWLIDHPWGRVTLFDLYVGFALFGGWIVKRERSVLVAVTWIMSLMVLGHWAACVYVIRSLVQSRGDSACFWMGVRGEQSRVGLSTGDAS